MFSIAVIYCCFRLTNILLQKLASWQFQLSSVRIAMKKMSSWSNSKTVSFINWIHFRPDVWDLASQAYKDKIAKKRAWEEIARKFHVSSDEAQKKFKNLRTYFNYEQKKLQSKQKSGKESTWFAFESMSFLLSKDLEELRLDNSSRNGNQSMVSESSIKEEDTINYEITTVDHFSTAPICNISEKRKHQELEEDKPQDAYDYVGMHDDVHKKIKTNTNAFGDYINQKLETYNKYVRSQVEFKISQILFEADMGYLNQPSPS